jgi:hypothetical protein
MKRVPRVSAAAWPAVSAAFASASAARNTPPQLQINSTASTEVVLSWPASATDFVLEEMRQLSALGSWEPVASEPTLSGQDFTVNLASAAHTRFFRLRYQPSVLRSTNSAISLALVAPDDTDVMAGQPFAVEVRASLNAVMAAAAGETIIHPGAIARDHRLDGARLLFLLR